MLFLIQKIRVIGGNQMDQLQIIKLKQELLQELHELETLQEHVEIPDTTELSSADQHPADNASDLTDQLTVRAISQYREQQIEKIYTALEAMDAKTYGKCIVCGEDIPFERLEIVPTSLRCVEHAEKELKLEDRPVEEEILSVTSRAIDFEMDGEMASSDTPQDRM